jgi:hypothetical protein
MNQKATAAPGTDADDSRVCRNLRIARRMNQ